MNNFVELKNLEIYEFCMLNKATGKMDFYKESGNSDFTGLYFRDAVNFLGIYPTENGPKIYYKGKEYKVSPNLDISLRKNGKNRKFQINDYNIEIDYVQSPYISFDAWSDEIDVDLLFMIKQSYKNQDFYDKFTL